MDESSTIARADTELLPRIAAGDINAFATLFRQHSGDVFRFVLHMTGSRSIADDVTQEVFLAVMRDAGRYMPGVSSETAWLCGIARNHVRRHLGRERRTVDWPGGDEGQAGVPGRVDDGGQLSEMVRTERIEAVRRAVASLPIRYREAVVLCDLQELSYADAASALGCAIGTVRSRLSRGRALLASKLGLAEESPAPDIDALPGGKTRARWAI